MESTSGGVVASFDNKQQQQVWKEESEDGSGGNKQLILASSSVMEVQEPSGDAHRLLPHSTVFNEDVKVEGGMEDHQEIEGTTMKQDSSSADGGVALHAVERSRSKTLSLPDCRAGEQVHYTRREHTLSLVFKPI